LLKANGLFTEIFLWVLCGIGIVLWKHCKPAWQLLKNEGLILAFLAKPEVLQLPQYTFIAAAGKKNTRQKLPIAKKKK